MNQIKTIISTIFHSKAPKSATHFFHEGGYITFMKDKRMFKPRKMTAKEYLDLQNSQLSAFINWSLIN